MRIVLDTNVLVSGIFWGGMPYQILELWAKQKIEVFVTPEILLEYNDVMAQLGSKEKNKSVEYWLQFIHERCTLIHPRHEVTLCRDPDDDKFISCALSARASFIVSGDKDLLTLKEVEKVEIITPGAFVKRM
ncbi:MAG: putative toxin-antitoxin system toxin component, PIN family [Fibrobacteria bacterium]|nr:putative toxin-antitoxin system toxin component, PIN family [Fibrobacteria bacterium]